MATDSPQLKKIILLTADEQEFELEEAVAMEFGIVKTFFEDNLDTCDEPMPLPNVESKYLSKIIEYSKWHLVRKAQKPRKPRKTINLGSEDEEDEEAKAFDQEFFNTLDNEGVWQMMLAANYLDAKELLEMLTQAVADKIQNKSVEYVRRFFGVENDYTPEEEAELRKKYEWAFEDVDPDDDI
ncbi:Nuclear transcription factor Y subunit C-2 isoform 1 [Hibiscus syriacus]|uniref:SKP1-like protein n=1 Tax=Hibiscus syriacus TaxID=106335 RepID=A0A6A2W9P2_HIBSY|nr:SKP1-like protein 14 [Hibiscus syriacus]KAE8654118.1 Nuclear transcription factor Y subunit C-2 isoform 1 [Hibiscus syriacus]